MCPEWEIVELFSQRRAWCACVHITLLVQKYYFVHVFLYVFDFMYIPKAKVVFVAFVVVPHFQPWFSCFLCLLLKETHTGVSEFKSQNLLV